ncbi:MAG: GNAT family N-acetyltransferase [Allorhizobium sp.]
MRTTSVESYPMQAQASGAERLATTLPAAAPRSVIVGDLRIELLTGMQAAEKDWRLLEADNLNSLHQGFDWCNAWEKTHGHPLAIIRASRNGQACFILPLEIQRHNMVRTAQFIAARFNNINTGLFSARFRASADAAEVRAIAAALVTLLAGKADLIALQNIPLEWRGSRHPLSGLPATEHQNHAFQLPLLKDMDATIGQLNAKRRRKKYRSQCRKLESVGGFEHLIAHSDADKQALLGLFFEQKAIRFKIQGLPNVFQAPETQAFFQMLSEADSGGGNAPLELNAIRLKGEHDGKIAAIAGLSRKGDHVICQFGSIDETLMPEASAGELLFWLMIEKSGAEGATLFDFGLGDQGYKRSWCTVETIQHDILLPVTSSGRLAALAQRGLTRTKAAIKGNPHLYALIQRIRAHADERPAQSGADKA